jgi:23S rRNA (cytidine1920-2'-O)/16S rRNA (cytidine1409-2'-O)-methyltransferase
MTLARLDAELHRRGLARSREHARQLIEQGVVTVNGVTARKAASRVDRGAPILVDQKVADVVSRGATKLQGALDALPNLSLDGRIVLDAGASTGGFTQVALRAGASRVIAVDVGYGQLAWELQSDPRVDVLDRTNVRTLTPDALPARPSVVLADLSFISLRLVLPALIRVVDPSGDLLLMVKPQFEVGREQVGSGVVVDPELRKAAVRDVVQAAADMSWFLHDVVASPLPGPRGNVEYFIWLRSEPGPSATDAMIAEAVRKGPA